MLKNPRTRIAPSPTGFLHIGTARTALFNYLFTKKNNGKFILRIEDTDKERSSKKYEKDIIEGLKWLNIQWDEGVSPDDSREEIGDYGPYRQSQRKETYTKYIKKLLKEGKAYYCFCTKEELEAQKQYQLSIGQPPKYNGKCRGLSKKEVEKNLKANKPYVIRFKTPGENISFNDLIKGKIEFDTNLLGDITIAKDEKNPLYNLAAVIDDYEMKITHVLRGEDHLSNTPKQIILFKAMGLDIPKYGHFPLIFGPDKTKLSKRHGTVSVNQYKEKGYLSEAIVNFISFLGWNPGSEKEIYSLNVLEKEFSIEKVQKSPSIFNIKKLDWLNGFYIRNKSLDRLTELCIPYLDLIESIFVSEEHLVGIGPVDIKQKFVIKETGERIEFEYLKSVISLYQERLKYLSEINELTDFFFKKQIEYEKQLLIWKDASEKEVRAVLEGLEGVLKPISSQNWVKDRLEEILLKQAEKAGDRGKILWPLRVALTGKKSSAPPFDIAEVLGKEKTLLRLRQAKEKL